MGRPKRDVRAAAEESMTPPDQLEGNQTVARVAKAEGNNLYSCLLPNQKTAIVELADRFRNTIWIKRGGYVLVALYPAGEIKARIEGEIVNVVRDEKAWRKQSYWFACLHYPAQLSSRLTISAGPTSLQSPPMRMRKTKSRLLARCRRPTRRKRAEMKPSRGLLGLGRLVWPGCLRVLACSKPGQCHSGGHDTDNDT